MLGTDHYDTFRALLGLAGTEVINGDQAGAQKLLRELADLQTKGYGAGTWRAVDVRLSNDFMKRVAGMNAEQRARLRQAQQLDARGSKQMEDGNYKEGLALASQAMEIRKGLLGPESPDALDSEGNVGWFKRELKDFKQAEAVCRDVLEKRRKLLGEEHPEVGLSNNLQGTVYLYKGDFKTAEPFFRRAAEIYLNAEGPLSNRYAMSLENLARMYEDMQRLSPFRALRTQVVEIRKQTLNRNDTWYARSLWNLASACENVGKYDKAQAALLEAVAIYKQKWGGDHLTTINCAAELAWCYQNTGNLDQALPLDLQLLETQRRVMGLDTFEVGLTLDRLTSVYCAKNDFPKALEFKRQAAEVFRKSLGEKDRMFTGCLEGVAGLLDTVGFQCRQHEDFTGARKTFREEMSIHTRLNGEKNWRVTNDRLSLAYVDQLEKLTPAERAELREAEELSNKARDLDAAHPRDAIAPAEKALEIQRRLLGEEHFVTINSLFEVSFLYRQMGEYAKAWPMTSRLPELCRKIDGELHPDYCTSLHNLASHYENQGDLSKAETIYQQALEAERKVYGEQDDSIAETLNSLAQIDKSMGRLGKAESLFRQALEIRKATVGTQDPHYAASLLALGFFYMSSLQDYGKAEPLIREAVDIYKTAEGVKHPDYALGIDFLASLYTNTGNYDRAEPLYKESLAIRKEVLGESHPQYATSLHNLANMYEAKGEFLKAEPLMLESLKIGERIHGNNYADNALSMSILARIYLKMGEYAKSEAMNQQALDVRKKTLGEHNADYAESLAQSAVLAGVSGHPERGVPLACEAVEIGKTDLEQNAAFQSERQQLAILGTVWRLLNRYLDITAKAGTPAESVYAQVLDWKGTVGARQQQLRRLHQQLRQSGNKEVVRIENELQEATRSLAEISQGKSSQAGELRFREQEFSDKIEDLQQQLAKVSVEFRAQMQLGKVNPDDIRRALPAGVALVDFLSYPQFVPAKEKGGKGSDQNVLAAFVVRPDKPIVRVELGPTEPIEQAIQQWRAHYGNKSGDDDPGAQLRQLIWQPLEKLVQPAGTVLISPNGLTAPIAWAALPAAKPGTFLIDDVSIAVIPIPRLLPQMLADNKSAESSVATKGPAKSPSLLLVGDVDFGADPGSGDMLAMDGTAARGGEQFNWPSLPGTRDEVAAIQSSFVKQFHDGSPTMLAQGRATKIAVTSAMARSEYIHLSTHGFFAPPEIPSTSDSSGNAHGAAPTGFVTSQNVSGYQPGLLSGLVLAGANRRSAIGKDDGILTALEVGEMDLHNVQLATLSACETGLGQTAGGEGLLGLQRAFQTAGAKAVVAGLWKVPDKATELLMSRFYDNLWRKRMPKLEALREAQRWLLHEGKKQRELSRGLELAPDTEEGNLQSGLMSPRYWAGFVLSGDWR